MSRTSSPPSTHASPRIPRRELLLAGAGAALALGSQPVRTAAGLSDERPLFALSLAQWSLHRMLRAGELEALDFPRFAKDEFGLEAVEYVNQFFADRAADFAWLGELALRCEDAGVRSLLVMIDGEGQLGDADSGLRRRAVERHFKWLAAARRLGCHSIRVNAGGVGTREEVQQRAADSLHRIARMAEDYELSVLVENHGGYSSDGQWLAATIRAADHPGVGTLPDFGNFHLGQGQWYDRYRGVAELMPFARAVSAKSNEFDAAGNEVQTDYQRMLRIVVDAAYRGHIGIEYEGSAHSEVEGVRLTKVLLERVRAELEVERQ